MHIRLDRHWITVVACVGVLGGALLSGCRDDAKMTELRDQQREILTKLSTLEEKIDKAARTAAAAPARPGPDPARAYALPLGKSPSRGPDNGAITIVEFSDYQCPYCAKS